MKIYKHRIFANWAKDERVESVILKEAIREIESGLFDAILGSGLYKKRIARKGQGKRGGYRTLIAFKQHDKAIFLFGFAKNERENIDDKTLESLKKLGQNYLFMSNISINEALKEGKLIEVI